MRNFARFLAMAMLFTVLTACGSDNTQGNNEVLQITPAASALKTEAVNMQFDLNAQKQTSKTVYGGGAVSSVLQSYKDEITQVSVFVQSSDYGEVADFRNLPVINGIFSTMRPDGSSMINLPVGEYIIWAECDNASGTTRFSGSTVLNVIVGGPNDCNIDMLLENIYVDLAIMAAPGNFDKSDGSYDTGVRYSGSSNTNDYRWFGGEQGAYLDFNGVLHLTIAINPLTTNKVWISVTDKDGMTIVQTIDLDMLVAVAAERNQEPYWYTYQKTDPISITFNFPQ